MTTGAPPPGAHGSVAEEIAALAEALRSRGRSEPGGSPAAGEEGGPLRERHAHAPGIDACEICPVCRAISALHTVSPAAVTSLADLARQAEITLRALAVDLQARSEGGGASAREDIPVDDLGDTGAGDVGDE